MLWVVVIATLFLADGEGSAPFLPMSQAAYTRHNAPIVQCKFSPNATQVASADMDGVMR